MDKKNMDTAGLTGGGNEMLLPESKQAEGSLPNEEAKKPETAERQAQAAMAMPRGNAFSRELSELLKLYPQLREMMARGEGLPREVMSACAKDGVPLRSAFAEYALQQARAELEQLRRENQILKQNAEAAAKAPVRGATAGGTETRGRDPFLEGLLSDH